MHKFVHVLILCLSLAYLAGIKQIWERTIEKLLRKFILFTGTKDYMLTFMKSDNLEVIGHSDSDFYGCIDIKKSTSYYIFILVCVGGGGNFIEEC
jgi:hypothetical protein